MAHKGLDKTKQRCAQAPVGGKLAHQQKQRNDHNIVVRQAGVGQVFQKIEQRQRLPVGQVKVTRSTGCEHRNADGHAQHQKQHQAAKNHAANRNAAHALAPVKVLARRCSASM